VGYRAELAADPRCVIASSSTALPAVDMGVLSGKFVDEPEQVLGAGEDVAEAVALLVGELIQLQHLREAEDGVERCAQLVAHARQVVALGLVGVLSGELGLLQRLLDLLAGGDVAAPRPTPGVPEVGVSCYVLVLVDQSTEDVAATQPAKDRPLLGSVSTDGTGVAWAKLRCGRRWL
jgi:hypothetical protein